MLIELGIAAAILTGTENQELQPEHEAEIALGVAQSPEYGLDAEQTLLLLVLRRCEGGAKGREWGVGSGDPDHPARRFADDPDTEHSVECQAKWAAGTIKKHYTTETGYDYVTFLRRWNPKGWKRESANVAFYLRKYGSYVR